MRNFVKGQVKEIITLNKDYINLKISLSLKNFDTMPGQFFMLSIPDLNFTFPRPFSILNIDGGKVQFLIKKVGKFTEKIFEIKKGETINLMGPSGNFFKKEENVALVAGGYGIAPLYFYIKKYENLKNIKLFYGGKSKKDILFYEKLKKSLKEKKLFITTEDGTLGKKGIVTDLLIKNLEKDKKIKKIYSCGPIPMFKKLNEIFKGSKIELFVSMDPLMACGYGVCLGCVIPTNKGNICACTEGPVFNSKEILWDKL